MVSMEKLEKVLLTLKHYETQWASFINLSRNELRSVRTNQLTTDLTCDLWNIRMPPVPSYERSYVDKCGGWKQSSFEYYAPKNTPVFRARPSRVYDTEKNNPAKKWGSNRMKEKLILLQKHLLTLYNCQTMPLIICILNISKLHEVCMKLILQVIGPTVVDFI